MVINPFHLTNLFLYPLKTSENQKISHVFRRFRMMSSRMKRVKKLMQHSLQIKETKTSWINVL